MKLCHVCIHIGRRILGGLFLVHGLFIMIDAFIPKSMPISNWKIAVEFALGLGIIILGLLLWGLETSKAASDMCQVGENTIDAKRMSKR